MPKKKSKYPYKKRSTSAKKSSPVKWLIGGVIIGLLVPSFFLLKPGSHDNTEKNFIISSSEMDASLQKPLTKKKRHAKKESASKCVDYGFYNLLSPDETHAASATQEVKKEPLPAYEFQLDIAEFNNFTKADELKARLVLMGFEVFISKNTEQKLTIYKVMAGPFHSKMQAKEVQKKLESNAINSVLVIK